MSLRAVVTPARCGSLQEAVFRAVGARMQVYNEGLPPSVGLFVLVWVLTFTLIHS